MIAIAEANQHLPEGAEPILVPPILLRGHDKLPEEMISERIVDGCGRALDGARITELVTPDPQDHRRGRTRGGVPCVRTKFREITVKRRERRSLARQLHEVVSLPATYDGRTPFWSAAPSMSAAEAAQRATASLGIDRPLAPPEPERGIEVRYEPLSASEPEPVAPAPEPVNEDAEIERLAHLGDRRAPGEGAFIGALLPGMTGTAYHRQ